MENFRLGSSKLGSVLILTAFAAVFLISMSALVTDVGYIYYNQARLQTAVNAGWKAGYDRMMQLRNQNSGPLSDDQRTQIRQHVLEVMSQNGYTPEELANVTISFDPNNRISVVSSQTVGLFFARVMDFKSADVRAARANHQDESLATLVPLAIPHGVVKDLTRTTYSVELFGSGTGLNNEFASGTEYILKLGEGDPGDTPNPDLKKILVPMDSGSQSSDGYLRAYGAAFWCLRIEDGSDQGFTPVEWLLNYRGGSFMLPYHPDILSKLHEYGVNYQVITGSTNIQAVYDQVNPNVLELFDRPRIAVYSSQGEPDPVEVILRTGRIPYGTYSLPPTLNADGWKRYETFSSSKCNPMWDEEILSDALDSYHWLHLHHEDFTGFSGGCDYFWEDCKDFYDNGWLGPRNYRSQRLACKERMCAYCRSKFNHYDGRFYDYTPVPNRYNPSQINCKNAIRRCADKQDYQGNYWRNNSNIYICRKGSVNYPQCWQQNDLRAIADRKGFTSDANSEPKPQYYVNPDGSYPLPDNPDGYFNRLNKIQKMKFALIKKIKDHVEAGGFLYAQCFAPETFDIANWQYGISIGQSPQEAYSNCVAFKNFHYKTFPRHEGRTWYSDINTREGSGDFNLLLPLDPRCQNHGSGYCADTGQGHTASFVKSKIDLTKTTILGYQANTGENWVKYLKGKLGKGDFTFMGGHYHHNTYAKRLVLNNVLLGSLVTKDVTGDDTPFTGKPKHNFGAIDPDNYDSGGATDYQDRFQNGFSGPLQINDRILPEPGNMQDETNAAVDFKVNGTVDIQPNTRIILPITDIGPEIPSNNTDNATATAIYDLVGTDNPNGTYDTSQYNFGSSVRIIGFAEFEIIDPTQYARTGDNIQAGDAGDLGNYQNGQVRGKFIRYIVKPGEMPLN